MLWHWVDEGAATLLALEPQGSPVHEGDLPIVLVLVSRLHRLHVLRNFHGRRLSIGLTAMVVPAWRMHARVHVIAHVVQIRALVAHADHVLPTVLVSGTPLVNIARLLRHVHSLLRVGLHRLLLQAELVRGDRLVHHRDRLLDLSQLHSDLLGR